MLHCRRRVHGVLGRGVRWLSAGSSQDEPFDVVVVGSGIVGSLVAARAALVDGLRVGVVEPRPPPPLSEIPVAPTDRPDLRVFAITPGSAKALGEVGAWDRLASSGRVSSFSSMQVWEALGSGHVRFEHSAGTPLGDVKRALKSVGLGRPHWGESDVEYGEEEPAAPDAEALAYVVENRVLQSALYDVLRESDGVELIAPGMVEGMTLPKEGDGALATLELEGGRVLESRLVVAADGANSRVRELAGLGAWGWAYEQKGLVCTVETDERGDKSAWQRFLPSGPIALLPLWDNLSSIVWSLPTEEANRLVGVDEEEFLRELNAALTDEPLSVSGPRTGGSVRDGESRSGDGPGVPFGGLLTSVVASADRLVSGVAQTLANRLPGEAGRATAFQDPPNVLSVQSPRASFPLRLSGASKYTRPRLALVGDAAHTVHPLAGQGLNLGIADAAALGDAIAEAASIGTDPGSTAALRPYGDGRQRANVAMMTIVDGIKRLYAGGGDSPNPLSLARTMGMSALNLVQPLKREIVLFAMGGSGSILAKAISSLANPPKRRRKGTFDWI